MVWGVLQVGSKYSPSVQGMHVISNLHQTLCSFHYFPLKIGIFVRHAPAMQKNLAPLLVNLSYYTSFYNAMTHSNYFLKGSNKHDVSVLGKGKGHVNCPVKKLLEKSRECHSHKPQPTPDTKRKRRMTKTNMHKTNKQTHETTHPQARRPQHQKER